MTSSTTFWVEVVGYLAAAAGLYSTYARTMIPLRAASIVANVMFIAYGLLKGIYPTILVNCVLLPLNFIRLRDMRSLISRVKTASEGDLNINWLQPFLSRTTFKAGETLWRKGDAASNAVYIFRGRVLLVEIGMTVEAGTLIGEMGLFDKKNQRTATVTCLTDIEAGAISYDEFRMLYFQNPEFGFYLLRLVTGRMQENIRRTQPAPEITTRRGRRRKRGAM